MAMEDLIASWDSNATMATKKKKIYAVINALLTRNSVVMGSYIPTTSNNAMTVIKIKPTNVTIPAKM